MKFVIDREERDLRGWCADAVFDGARDDGSHVRFLFTISDTGKSNCGVQLTVECAADETNPTSGIGKMLEFLTGEEMTPGKEIDVEQFVGKTYRIEMKGGA